VSDAIRTDLVLSAEIMVIALNEVASQPLVSRAVILVVVAFALTVLVYGVVGLIVKMDDIGLSLTGRRRRGVQQLGHALVAGMPKLLAVISAVGTGAMLWVGGHILLAGVNELGWHAPHELVHHLSEQVHHTVRGIGAGLGWLVSTAASALVGLVVGAVAVAVMQVLPFGSEAEASSSRPR
jgi:predicted DNA repair protein MutK